MTDTARKALIEAYRRFDYRLCNGPPRNDYIAASIDWFLGDGLPLFIAAARDDPEVFERLMRALDARYRYIHEMPHRLPGEADPAIVVCKPPSVAWIIPAAATEKAEAE